MRKYSATLGNGGRSAALVARLTREFVRPHAKQIAIAFVLMGAASASTALRAWLMQPVLDRIFVGREEAFLLVIAGGALVLALVKGLADYGNAVLMNRVGQRVIADVQKALFARLMRADLAYFHTHPTGALISRFTNDAVLLRGAAANVLGAIGRDAVSVIFLVGVMFYQDWLLALVSFFVFPLAIHPIVGIGRRMRRVSANTQVEIGQLTTLLNQTFQGARHVKAYGMEAYEERRAATLFERLFRLIDRATRTRSRASPMMETLGGVAIAAVILY
ncbi:MAG: ABC transporter permease, partial [Alphaproteobacteria bacterium]|nr:ABC transporter permease [Alphaproteobacteria bacterium]